MDNLFNIVGNLIAGGCLFLIFFPVIIFGLPVVIYLERKENAND